MASGLENEFVTLHEIVKAAKVRLNANIWDYLIGGTETETTLRRNRMALEFDRLQAARAAQCLARSILRRRSSARRSACR